MSQFNPFDTGPMYNRHAPRWQLELDASEFTLDVVDEGTYLRRFSEAEHPDDYAYRKSMCCPMDMCRDGVRIRVDNLWRTAPKREVTGSKHKAVVEQLVNDADGDGTTLDDFMRSACWDQYVTGTDIVTQTTAAEGEVKTLADQQRVGLRPYFMRFSPLERYDWAVAGTGAFTWARYCLGADMAADEKEGPSGWTQFLTLSREGWRRWRARKKDDEQKSLVVELVGEGTSTLGVVPVVKLYFSESAKPGQGAVPLSLLTRPALVAKVAMNLKSQADADLLSAVTRWMLSGAGSEELPDTYAAGVMWKIPNPEAKLTVAQGDVRHITEKRDWLTLYIEEIIRLLKFRGGMAEMNASSGSGLKLAIERTDLDNELRATAGQLEAAELEMMRQAVSLSTGKVIAPENAAEELGYTTQYNRDFVLEPVGEMLDNLKKWVTDCGLTSDSVPAVTREMLRQLANMLARDNTDPHREMMEEIDSASFDGGGEGPVAETPVKTLTGGVPGAGDQAE